MTYYCYFDSEQSDGHMGCFFPTRGHHVHILNLNPPPLPTNRHHAHLFIATVNNVCCTALLHNFASSCHSNVHVYPAKFF